MSGRPAAAPGLLAQLAAAAPARLVKKLDQTPRMADGWAWEPHPDGTLTVTVEGRETVTVRPEGGVVSAAGQLTCTCLLSPRCLHVLAVATALPLGDDATPAAAATAAPLDGPRPDASEAAEVLLSDPQRAAARSAMRALGEMLAAGALGSGSVLQGEVLRALNAARVAALPRLAAALLRVVLGVRACRAKEADFDLGHLAAALGEAVVCAQALARADGPVASRWVGVARRDYAWAGTLRLHGVFTEPVVGGGHAGVVTYFLGPGGEFLTSADVLPATVGQGAGAYLAGARLGGGSLVPRDLCRSALYVEGATVSSDGRLGAGKDVRAVRASASSWTEQPLADLFAKPLAHQVRGVFERMEGEHERRAGDDLLFAEATVLGAVGDALLLQVGASGDDGGSTIEALAPPAMSTLAFRDNLERLARSPGLSLRLVGRLAAYGRPRLTLLAVGPREGGESLVLPPEWVGRVNLGLDRLPGIALSPTSGGYAAPVASVDSPPFAEGLLPLERRIGRLALGGRATLAGGAFEEALRDARTFDERLMPGAGACLRALCGAARARGATSAERLAEAFGAASEHLRVARLALEEAAWP